MSEAADVDIPEVAESAPQADPPTPPAPPAVVSAPRRATEYALLGALLYLVFYAVMTAFNANADRFPLPPLLWALLPPLTTVLYLIVLLYAIRALCRPQATPTRETLLMFLCLCFFLFLNPTVDYIVLRLLHGDGLEKIIGTLQLQTYDTFLPAWLGAGRGLAARGLEVLVPFLLILTGIYFGQLLSRVIREQAMLVPVGIVAGLVDLWGVYWGPVSIMSERAPAAVSGLATAATTAARLPDSVKLPEHLAYFGHIAPPDNIGIGDFVFLAFFLTCAYRFGFSAKRTMWGIFVGLLASSVVLALNGLTIFGVDINIEYLPGLLFICGGVLIANAGSWKLSRQEWVITGVLAAIMVALVGSFAVRANIGKPLHASASYTVTAASAPELLAAIRAHIASERHAPPNLDLLAANLYYLRKDIARGPVQVELQLLGRQQRVTLPSTREYLVLCGLNPAVPHQWQVQQTMDAPPRQAVGLLAKLASPPPAPSSLDDLGLQTRLLRDAPAVPPVTPELLAPLLTALRKVPQGQAVLLRLIPTRVLIVDEHRNIQRLPYPSAVNKTKH